ncbi:hypothetical protein PPL_06250 [Heterostelium album PN500]|uniref:RRM domain-containing protein n=1 Tax=Heterostelium pallidum (strain ATCC 26659 / Pp 5 / PN500) TaxID=670386 RepID=D3BCM5_HETP5|nr:hypothetical protein PPL_06250 [Heterostelium album PN500]EFA80667.1 hypothetical protein PPL_06250 [Heterostelium album PN500]|eukprot:XP_020432787.1 hypothetical protein PPL_06250 [Heterostelium album PN500]
MSMNNSNSFSQNRGGGDLRDSRDNGSRGDMGSRDMGNRDMGGRDMGGRDMGSREPSNKLYIRLEGVPSFTDKDLYELFIKYGKITNHAWKIGFGFVEYQSVNQALDAISQLQSTMVMGKKIFIDFSSSKRERHPMSTIITPKAPRVYINYDNESTHPNDLKALFSSVGEIIHNHFVDKKGYGFVEYATVEEAERAISQYHGYEIHNRKLLVNYATMPGTKPRSRSRSPRSIKRTRYHSPRGGRSMSRSRSPGGTSNNNNMSGSSLNQSFNSNNNSFDSNSNNNSNNNYNNGNFTNQKSYNMRSGGSRSRSPVRGRSRSRSNSPDSKNRMNSNNNYNNNTNNGGNNSGGMRGRSPIRRNYSPSKDNYNSFIGNSNYNSRNNNSSHIDNADKNQYRPNKYLSSHRSSVSNNDNYQGSSYNNNNNQQQYNNNNNNYNNYNNNNNSNSSNISQQYQSNDISSNQNSNTYSQDINSSNNTNQTSIANETKISMSRSRSRSHSRSRRSRRSRSKSQSRSRSRSPIPTPQQSVEAEMTIPYDETDSISTKVNTNSPTKDSDDDCNPMVSSEFSITPTSEIADITHPVAAITDSIQDDEKISKPSYSTEDIAASPSYSTSTSASSHRRSLSPMHSPNPKHVSSQYSTSTSTSRSHHPVPSPQSQSQSQSYSTKVKEEKKSSSHSSSIQPSTNHHSHSQHSSHSNQSGGVLVNESISQDIRNTKDNIIKEVFMLFDEMKKHYTRECYVQTDVLKSDIYSHRKDTTNKHENTLRKFEEQLSFLRRISSVSESNHLNLKDFQGAQSSFQVDINFLKSDITSLKMEMKDCNSKLDHVLQELRSISGAVKNCASQDQINSVNTELRRVAEASQNASNGSVMKKLFPIDALSNKLFNVEAKLESLETSMTKQFDNMKNEILTQNAIQGMVQEDKKRAPTRKKSDK